MYRRIRSRECRRSTLFGGHGTEKDQGKFRRLVLESSEVFSSSPSADDSDSEILKPFEKSRT